MDDTITATYFNIAIPMKKNQEPEQLASIAISRDEIAGRQRPTGRVRNTGGGTSSGAPRLLWILTIFSVLLSIGILAHLQQAKAQSDKQLKALTILQARLSSTDEQSNLSVDAIKILLKEQAHEIRKLWDVTNKRNKSNISKNTRRLDDQNKLLTQYSSKLTQIGKKSAALKVTVASQITQSEQSLSSNMQTIKNHVSEIETKVNQTVKGMPKNLSKTLSDHGKGISAMDKTRLQLLKKIKALEAQVETIKNTAANNSASKVAPPNS
jgi:hypothetical protein